MQVPVAWGAARLLGLEGLALALASATSLVLVALLVVLATAGATIRALTTAALVVVGLTLAAFVPPSIVLGDLESAGVGLVLYVALLTLIRPRGLALGWRYLRALE